MRGVGHLVQQRKRVWQCKKIHLLLYQKRRKEMCHSALGSLLLFSPSHTRPTIPVPQCSPYPFFARLSWQNLRRRGRCRMMRDLFLLLSESTKFTGERSNKSCVRPGRRGRVCVRIFRMDSSARFFLARKERRSRKEMSSPHRRPLHNFPLSTSLHSTHSVTTAPHTATGGAGGLDGSWLRAKFTTLADPRSFLLFCA